MLIFPKCLEKNTFSLSTLSGIQSVNFRQIYFFKEHLRQLLRKPLSHKYGQSYYLTLPYRDGWNDNIYKLKVVFFWKRKLFINTVG